MFEIKDKINSISAILIGIFSDFLVAAFLGIITVYILYYTEKEGLLWLIRAAVHPGAAPHESEDAHKEQDHILLDEMILFF